MIVPRRVRPLWWHKPAGRANSDHEYESTQASPESRSVSLLQEKDNVSKSCPVLQLNYELVKPGFFVGQFYGG